jgi:hypothetical protein
LPQLERRRSFSPLANDIFEACAYWSKLGHLALKNDPEHVPDNWTKEDLEQAQHELQESIKARKAEQSQYGEEGGHRERIRGWPTLSRCLAA